MHFQCFWECKASYELAEKLRYCCYNYSELQLLLKVKASLVGPTGSSLEDWKLSSSLIGHCLFSGFSRDQSSNVASMNISFVPLFEAVQKSEHLILYAVNLTGPLPFEIANLESLKIQNISTTTIIRDFALNMTSRMTKLEVLGAYNNNFSCPVPRFVNLNQLEYLNLGGNYFSGKIPSFHSKLQRLENRSLAASTLLQEESLSTWTTDFSAILWPYENYPFDFWPTKLLEDLHSQENNLSAGQDCEATILTLTFLKILGRLEPFECLISLTIKSAVPFQGSSVYFSRTGKLDIARMSKNRLELSKWNSLSWDVELATDRYHRA
ncbi:hypothetical protein Cgig2_004357 [Carnegiea gigantea]|uniref:Uncharacterized protein n=1 Tax=Carnegiea gigantea TaxID=171969 RepID=A0A9Q1GS20_9CARY|nr:hypothetical protein Cgig2_004357 [Carnegiea gigantea]